MAVSLIRKEKVKDHEISKQTLVLVLIMWEESRWRKDRMGRVNVVILFDHNMQSRQEMVLA